MGDFMETKLLLTIVTEFIVPWFMKKREQPVIKNKTPDKKKKLVPKTVDQIVTDVADNYQFSPTRSAINAVIGGLLLFAVDTGYISLNTSDCLGDAAGEVVEKVVDK